MKNQLTLRLCITFSVMLMALPNRAAFAQDVATAARANRARASATATQPEGTLAKVRCLSQPYVLVTADPERTVPLNSVATLKCDEEVRILADDQGYTVRVRTADGRIGYVTRYEVAIVVPTAQPAAASGALGAPNDAPAHSEAKPATESYSEVYVKDSSKPRVYLSDTQSWAASGGFSKSSSVADSKLYGGYDPEMSDIYQDFTSNCSTVVVTQEKSKANYVVLFDKGATKKGLTGLGGLVRVNKVTVLSLSGETVFAREAHSADAVVRLTCEVLAERTISTVASPAHP